MKVVTQNMGTEAQAEIRLQEFRVSSAHGEFAQMSAVTAQMRRRIPPDVLLAAKAINARYNLMFGVGGAVK